MGNVHWIAAAGFVALGMWQQFWAHRGRLAEQRHHQWCATHTTDPERLALLLDASHPQAVRSSWAGVASRLARQRAVSNPEQSTGSATTELEPRRRAG